MLTVTACLGERERPGPPRVSFTIDDPLVVSSRQDTVGGNLRVDDPDGIDSVWVKLETVEQGFDGGLHPAFSTHWRFVVQGFSPSDQIPLVVRARDVAGFAVQRDTYVVVIP